MADSFTELRRDISLFLSSLRHSIDRPYRVRSANQVNERERFLRTMLLVEEARIRFNTFARYLTEPSSEEWREIRVELSVFIENFLHSREIEQSVYERPFRVGPNPLPLRENPSPLFAHLFSGQPPTIGAAIVAFRERIEAATFSANPRQQSLNFGNLENIVPRQQVAPIQFEIIGSRISVAHYNPKTLPEDRKNIESALDHIRGRGENLMENLENSNCDKRLIESIRELQSQLVSNGNVVKIGLTNLACSVMCGQFQAEIPNAIAAMFNSYSTSVSLYVAQFPEWEQFTQKAAQIELSAEDVADVDRTAGDLVDALLDNPDIAESEVPKTIAFIRQFLAVPGASAKRAAFAMIRTIESGIQHPETRR